MKKGLYLLVGILAAFTSCSNDELIDVNANNVITFESHVDKGTRAVTNTTTDELKKFYVFGNYGETNVFHKDGDAIAVTKNNTSKKWEYTNPVTWTANKYMFAAYATKNESDQIAVVYDKVSGAMTFNNIITNDANDIVAAATSVDNTNLTNPTVDLEFKHLLSKVQFAIKNGTSNYKMKVSNITFSALSKGNCTFSNNAIINWTPNTTEIPAIYSFTGTGDTKTDKSATFNSEDHIVIPNQDLSDVQASFTVEFHDDANQIVDTRTFTNVSLSLGSGNKWQPGYIYKYTGTATSTIKFSVSVEKWEDKTATPGISL